MSVNNSQYDADRQRFHDLRASGALANVPELDIEFDDEYEATAAARISLEDAEVMLAPSTRQRGNSSGPKTGGGRGSRGPRQSAEERIAATIDPYAFDVAEKSEEEEDLISVTETEKTLPLIPMIAAALYHQRLIDSYTDHHKTFARQGLIISSAVSYLSKALQGQDGAGLENFGPLYTEEDIEKLKNHDQLYANIENSIYQFLALPSDRKKQKGPKTGKKLLPREEITDSDFDNSSFQDDSEKRGRFILRKLGPTKDHLGKKVNRYEIRVNVPITLRLPILADNDPVKGLISEFVKLLRTQWYVAPLVVFEQALINHQVWSTVSQTAKTRLTQYLASARTNVLDPRFFKAYDEGTEILPLLNKNSIRKTRPDAKGPYRYSEGAKPLVLEEEAGLVNNDYFAIYTKFVKNSTANPDLPPGISAYLCFMITPRYLTPEGAEEPQMADVFDWAFAFLTNLVVDRYHSIGPIAPFHTKLDDNRVVDNARDRYGFVVLGNGKQTYVNPLGPQAVEFYNGLRNEMLEFFASFSPPLAIGSPANVRAKLRETVQYVDAPDSSDDPNVLSRTQLESKVIGYITKLGLFANSTLTVNWDLNVRVQTTASGYVQASRDIRGAIPLNDGMIVDALYPRKAIAGTDTIGISGAELDVGVIEKDLPNFLLIAPKLVSLALFLNYLDAGYRTEFNFDGPALKAKYEALYTELSSKLEVNRSANGRAISRLNQSNVGLVSIFPLLERILLMKKQQEGTSFLTAWYELCSRIYAEISSRITAENDSFTVTRTLYITQNENGEDELHELTSLDKEEITESGIDLEVEEEEQPALRSTPHVKLRSVSEYRLITRLILDLIEPLAHIVVPPSQKWKQLKPRFFDHIVELLKIQFTSRAAQVVIPLRFFDDPASLLLLGLVKSKGWEELRNKVDEKRLVRMRAQTYIGPTSPNAVAEATANPLPIPYLGGQQEFMPHQYAALRTAHTTTPAPEELITGDVNGYVADIEPGGGKTLICIAEISMLLRKGWIRRPVVLVPQGLIRNWVNEIASFTKGQINTIVVNNSTAGSQSAWKVPVTIGDTVADFSMLDKFLQAHTNFPINTIILASFSMVKSMVPVRYLDQTIETYPWTRVFRELGVDYVAIDECHNIRQADTSQAKFMYSLRTMPTLKYIRLFSGTMIVNKPSDLLGQINLINPAALGGTEETFNKRFLEDVRGVDDKLVTVANIPAITSAVNRNMTIVRFKQRHWAKFLPDLQENIVFIDVDIGNANIDALDGWQKSYTAFLTWYNFLLEETINEFISTHKGKVEGETLDANAKLARIFERMRSDSKRTKLNYNSHGVLVTDNSDEDELDTGEDETAQESALRFCLQKVEQFALHPEFHPRFEEALKSNRAGTAKTELESIAHLVRSPKIYDPYNGLLALLDKNFAAEGGSSLKVIVTATYQVALEAVEKAFAEHKGGIYSKMAIYCTSGNTSDVAEFTHGSKRILVGTDGTIGTGLNLQAASLMIKLDFPWTPGALIQSMARIFRPRANSAGSLMSTRRVIRVLHLVTNFTLESAKFQRLLCKMIQKAQIDEASSREPEIEPIKKLLIPPLAKMSASIFKQGARESGAILGWYRKPSTSVQTLEIKDIKPGIKVYNEYGIAGIVRSVTETNKRIYIDWLVTDPVSQPTKVLDFNFFDKNPENDEAKTASLFPYPLFASNPRSNLDMPPEALEGRTLDTYMVYKRTYNEILNLYADQFKDLEMVQAGTIAAPEESAIIPIRKPGDRVKLPDTKRRKMVESMATAPYSYGEGELTLAILDRWKNGSISNLPLGPDAISFIKTQWAAGEVYERALERAGSEDGGIIDVPKGFKQVRLSSKPIPGWHQYSTDSGLLQYLVSRGQWNSKNNPTIWSSRKLVTRGGICIKRVFGYVDITTSQLTAILPLGQKFAIYLSNPSDPSNLLKFEYVEQANLNGPQDTRLTTTVYSADDQELFNSLQAALDQEVAIEKVQEDTPDNRLPDAQQSNRLTRNIGTRRIEGVIAELEQKLQSPPAKPVLIPSPSVAPAQNPIANPTKKPLAVAPVPVSAEPAPQPAPSPVVPPTGTNVGTLDITGPKSGSAAPLTYIPVSEVASLMHVPGTRAEATYSSILKHIANAKIDNDVYTVLLYGTVQGHGTIPMGFNVGVMGNEDLAIFGMSQTLGAIKLGVYDLTLAGAYVLLTTLRKKYRGLQRYTYTLTEEFKQIFNTLQINVDAPIVPRALEFLVACDLQDEAKMVKMLRAPLTKQQKSWLAAGPFDTRSQMLIWVENPCVASSDLRSMPAISKLYPKYANEGNVSPVVVPSVKAPPSTPKPTLEQQQTTQELLNQHAELVLDNSLLDDSIVVPDDVADDLAQSMVPRMLEPATYDAQTGTWGPLPSVGTVLTSTGPIQLIWELVGPRKNGNLVVRRTGVVFGDVSVTYPSPIEEILNLKLMTVQYAADKPASNRLAPIETAQNKLAPRGFADLESLVSAMPVDGSWAVKPFWVYKTDQSVRVLTGVTQQMVKGEQRVVFIEDSGKFAAKPLVNRMVFSQPLLPDAAVLPSGQTREQKAVQPAINPTYELLPPRTTAPTQQAGPQADISPVSPADFSRLPIELQRIIQRTITNPSVLAIIWGNPTTRQPVYEAAVQELNASRSTQQNVPTPTPVSKPAQISEPPAQSEETDVTINVGTWNGVKALLVSGRDVPTISSKTEHFNIGTAIQILHSRNQSFDESLVHIVRTINGLGLDIDSDNEVLSNFFKDGTGIRVAQTVPTDLSTYFGRTKHGKIVYLYPASTGGRKMFILQLSPSAAGHLGTLENRLKTIPALAPRVARILNLVVIPSVPKSWEAVYPGLTKSFNDYKVLPSSDIKVLRPARGSEGESTRLETK